LAGNRGAKIFRQDPTTKPGDDPLRVVLVIGGPVSSDDSGTYPTWLDWSIQPWQVRDLAIPVEQHDRSKV
jgi:hypothetical protein